MKEKQEALSVLTMPSATRPLSLGFFERAVSSRGSRHAKQDASPVLSSKCHLYKQRSLRNRSEASYSSCRYQNVAGSMIQEKRACLYVADVSVIANVISAGTVTLKTELFSPVSVRKRLSFHIVPSELQSFDKCYRWNLSQLKRFLLT